MNSQCDICMNYYYDEESTEAVPYTLNYELEELIAKSEEQIALLTSELEKPEVYSDYIKLTEIQEKLSAEQTA